MLNEGNQIHHFISSSGTGTVINYGSGSDFLTSYGSGSGSTSQKVTVPTVPVPQLGKTELTSAIILHSLPAVLQHLVCIRDDAQTRPAYYKLIEECVSQIVLHKSGCDPDFRATQRFNIDVEPLIEQLVERGRMEDGASANGSMGMNAGNMVWHGHERRYQGVQ